MESDINIQAQFKLKIDVFLPNEIPRVGAGCGCGWAAQQQHCVE